jgi:hypothetical protein
MDSKFFAFSAMASILLLGVLAAAINIRSAYGQSNDLWYVGEGAEQDMYVIYRVQDFETNDNRPFLISIWFKEKDNDVWVAPTEIKDEESGSVYGGTLRLSESLGVLYGSSEIPDDMRRYIGGYSNSLVWLESYSPKAKPQSLSAGSWGRIGSIGGSEIKPTGKEQVTAAGKTFDTTVIAYFKGVNNRIWVVDNFPYPVKAETFVEVVAGQPPYQYAYTLLSVGTGQPPAFKEEENIPLPPLKRTTGRGTYNVDISWTPERIEPGKEVGFVVGFTDSNSQQLTNVSYDITIKDSSGQVIKEFKRQVAQEGVGTVSTTFDNGGPMTVTVKINSVSGQTTGEFIEQADFNIVVVPEFPATAAIIAGAVIGFVVLATRFRGQGIGSMFGGRSPF